MKINQIKGKQINIIEKMENTNINYNDNEGKTKKNSLFIYLSSFVVIIGSVLGSVYLISVRNLEVHIVLPLIIVGVIMIFTVIGAFQLRNDEKLTENNFIELMKMSFLKLPVINLFTGDDKSKTED
jgi:Na+/H+-translocating membrane pyrophosphatase